MNNMRGWLIGCIGLVGCALLLPPTSFAHQHHAEHKKADIQLLRDSASALQTSRPDLANGLTAYADRETKELDERMTREEHEKEEPGEKVEPKNEQHESTPTH